MTRGPRVSATRSNLVRARRRLDQVRRGAALLRRKRETLVKELFARAKTAVTSREAIESQARDAWRLLWSALAAQDAEGLAAAAWPTRPIDVHLETTELLGLRVVSLVDRPRLIRSLAARGVAIGADEGGTADAAAAFETLVEQLIEAAPKEQVMRRIGQALSRTTRLVNTLEQRVAVQVSRDVDAILRTLDEREREEHQRIKRLVARRRDAPGVVSPG